MLSKATLQIIQGLSLINNKIVLEYPQSTITNLTQDIHGIIHLDKTNDSFETIGLWDSASFLAAISVLDEPTISLTDNILTAKDEYSTINYVVSSPSICEDAVTDPKIITSTMGINSDVEVRMDVDLVARVKRGLSIFKTLKDIFFIKEGDVFYLETGNKESFSTSQNSYRLKLTATKIQGEDFKICIPGENFMSLPNMDMEFKIHHKDGQRRISMSNEIMSFVLSLKR